MTSWSNTSKNSSSWSNNSQSSSSWTNGSKSSSSWGNQSQSSTTWAEQNTGNLYFLNIGSGFNLLIGGTNKLQIESNITSNWTNQAMS